MYRFIYFLRFFIVISISILFVNASTNEVQMDKPHIHVGILVDDYPLVYKFDENYTGYGIAWFNYFKSQILETYNINFEYSLEPYQSHEIALEDLNNNKIQILLGSFSKGDVYGFDNIKASSNYFIDELRIITSKSEITFGKIFKLIWTPLFKDILLSTLIGIFIFAILIIIFEGSQHPNMKKRPIKSKWSYSFFVLFTCYLRDITYDPATNAGRIIFTLWMIFSLVMMAIITAMITSAVLRVSHFNQFAIQSVETLYNQPVGFIENNSSEYNAIRSIGGRPIPYTTIYELVEAVNNNQINFAVMGKSTWQNFDKFHYGEFKNTIMSTSIIGYESFVIPFNKKINLDKKHPFNQLINDHLYLSSEDHKRFNICKQFFINPYQCNVN